MVTPKVAFKKKRITLLALIHSSFLLLGDEKRSENIGEIKKRVKKNFFLPEADVMHCTRIGLFTTTTMGARFYGPTPLVQSSLL